MPKQWDPLSDMRDLHGKTAVVTGGNAGIGLATVKFLALRGAKVYLTARSESKAKLAVKTILAEAPAVKEEQIVWLPLELGDLKSVSGAVDELKRKESKIDILINNAGMATGSEETAGDGWEIHMAVCHVGHFVFTNGLLPLLKAAAAQEGADVRIVTLSSAANTAVLPPSYEFRFTSPDFLRHPASSYPWTYQQMIRPFLNVDLIRYAVSKVANLLFAQELQRRLDEQGLPILSISVHPGSVASDGALTLGGSFFKFVARSTFVSIDQGAVTSLFAATASQVRQNPGAYKGKYLEPFGKVGTPHKVTRDQKQIDGLWENTTSEVNKYLESNGLPLLQAW